LGEQTTGRKVDETKKTNDRRRKRKKTEDKEKLLGGERRFLKG